MQRPAGRTKNSPKAVFSYDSFGVRHHISFYRTHRVIGIAAEHELDSVPEN